MQESFTAHHHFVQPFLHVGLALQANPALVAPTVNHNMNWGIFKPVEKKFNQVRKLYNNRKNKRQAIGRPQKGFGGRQGFDFYGLLRAYILAPLFRIDTNPADIHAALYANPAFLCEVAFRPKQKGRGRTASIIINPFPSYDVINDFDNIMTEFGLWEEVRRLCTIHGIEQGVIPKKIKLGIDPTPIKAASNPNNKKKRCGCKDKKRCQHRRTPTDPNAGYYNKGDMVLKSAHRPVILGELEGGVPLTSFMLKGNKQMDAATYQDILAMYKQDPSLNGLKVYGVYADGEFSTEENKALTKEQLKTRLITPINPRRRKEISVEAKGIKHINKYGVPVCEQNHKFTYRGRDYLRDAYIWSSPREEKGGNLCWVCPSPCTSSKGGRLFRVSRDDVPWVDWSLPEFSYRFKLEMALRTEMERIISRLKYLCGMKGLTKRGKKKAQSFVTRAIIVAQVVGIVAHKLKGRYVLRRIRTFPLPIAA